MIWIYWYGVNASVPSHQNEPCVFLIISLCNDSCGDSWHSSNSVFEFKLKICLYFQGTTCPEMCLQLSDCCFIGHCPECVYLCLVVAILNTAQNVYISVWLLQFLNTAQNVYISLWLLQFWTLPECVYHCQVVAHLDIARVWMAYCCTLFCLTHYVHNCC